MPDAGFPNTADERAVSPATAHEEAQDKPHFEHEHVQVFIYDKIQNDVQPIIKININRQSHMQSI